MGITSGQRAVCLELIQQMAYSTSEEKYNDIYTRFCDCAPPTVLQYFNTQWHPILDQWVMGIKYKTGNFLNGTNNRLESLNQKLKSVITRYSSLEEFIEKFFLILRVLRSERDHKAALLVQKVPTAFHSSTSHPDLLSYMKYLTPYACHFVTKQMELMKKVQVQQKDDGTCEVMSSEGLLTVTELSCACSSWLSMKLPCRHILATRSLLKMALYEESLCSQRWTAEYYKASQRVFLDEDAISFDSEVPVTRLPALKRRALSQAEKFKRASRLSTKLASLASESTGEEFSARCGILEKIVRYWEEGKELSFDSVTSTLSAEEGTHCILDVTESDQLTDWQDQTASERAHSSSDVRTIEIEVDDNGIIVEAELKTLDCGSTSSTSNLLVPEGNTMQCETWTQEGKENESNTTQIRDIIVPPAIKKRGRPRGHETTVIGLPCKKHKKSSKIKPQPFIKLHTTIKEKAMLRWFVEEDIVQKALKNSEHVIEEEDVEIRPERISDAVMDENVDVHLIRHFFSFDAWLAVNSAVEVKQARASYVCGVCSHDVHEQPSIVCDHCLKWWHNKCVGLKQQPKTKYWYCRSCHDHPLDS